MDCIAFSCLGVLLDCLPHRHWLATRAACSAKAVNTPQSLW